MDSNKITVFIIGKGYPNVLDFIEEMNKENKNQIFVRGYLDDNKKLHNKNFNGFKVIGSLSMIKKHKNARVINAVCSSSTLRNKIFEKIKRYNGKLINIIHPKAIYQNARLGKGLIIGPNVYFGKNSIIGDGSVISFNSHVGHDTKIGKNCIIESGSMILGWCKIGNHVHIGSNATIKQSIFIGNNVVVGMGSVVIENVKNFFSVFGNPARTFYKRNK